MHLAMTDIVWSKACLKSEYLKVFVFRQNAAPDDIRLSPNGLRARGPAATLAPPTKTFLQVFARRSRLAAGPLARNETYDYLGDGFY